MLNIFGPLNNLGMGVHTYNLAKAYQKLFFTKIPYSGQPPTVAVFPPFGHDQIKDVNTMGWLMNQRFANVKNNPALMIFDMNFFPHFAGRPRIGMCVFETNGFSELQAAGIRGCDRLITPSKWGKEIISDVFDEEAEVVNEGFDPEEYPKREVPYRDPSKPFTFITVGKFEERKGTAQLIHCFAKAFMNKENVELWLHCENPFLEGSGRSQVSDILRQVGFVPTHWQIGNRPTIWTRGNQRVIWDERRDNMATLYEKADCSVFPSKGEGWGLPIIECLAMGIPTIVGRWSAMTEYIPDDYPEDLQIWHARMDRAADGIWFHGERGDWYVPPDDSVMRALSWAYFNARVLEQTPIWQDQVNRVREFTWDRAARQLDIAIKKFMLDV